MTIFNYARGDLERDKFVTDSSGNIAINVKVTDTLPISLTGDVEIGAVEIKDSGTDNRVSVDTSGALSVQFNQGITSSIDNFPNMALETGNIQTIKETLTDGSLTGSVAISSTDLDIRDLNTASDEIMAFQGGTWTSSIDNFPATQSIIGDVGITNSSIEITGNIGFTNSTIGVTGTFWPNIQTISGQISVTNSVSVTGDFYPSTQSVSVVNFPSTQTISGDVGITNSSFEVNITNSELTITGSVDVNNFPATQSISGNIGVTNSSFDVGNFPSNFPDTSSINELQILNSLIPAKFDYITCSYDTSGNLTSSIFKINGATGSTISTLAMDYDTGGNLLSVAKS